MFRKLQTNTNGILYLHSMPGRYEAITKCLHWMEELGIKQIICLASEKEIATKSPDYTAAIAEDRIPIKQIYFPVPDYGIPEDTEQFYALAMETAEQLTAGKNMFVHCAGGIGRTGMFAGCVLKALGEPQDALEESGSDPEDAEQERIIQNF